MGSARALRSRIDSSFLALEIVRRTTPRTLYTARQSVLLENEDRWDVVAAADWDGPEPEFACAIAPEGVAKELFESCDEGSIIAAPSINRDPADRSASRSERREILADLGPGRGVFAPGCEKLSVSRLNSNYAMEKGCGDYNGRVLVKRDGFWKVLANADDVSCTSAPPGVIASVDTLFDPYVGTCTLPIPSAGILGY